MPATSAGGVSLSKLKSNLRQATRLLGKANLDAKLRVETERRVESLREEIAAEEQKRPAPAPVTAPAPAAAAAAAREKGGANSAPTAPQLADAKGKDKGKGKQKEEGSAKKSDRYKMLRHFEYQKARRRCKKARNELNTGREALAEADAIEDGRKREKKLKKANKDLERLQGELELARIDAWYIEVRGVRLSRSRFRTLCRPVAHAYIPQTFPPAYKYVSLYPSSGYVPFTLASLPAPPSSMAESDLLSAMPSAKKPDDVRSYWRSIAKARLDNGQLTGEPIKIKKQDNEKKRVPASELQAQGDSSEGEPAQEGASGEDDSESTSEAGSDAEEEAIPDVDLGETDDFFAA